MAQTCCESVATSDMVLCAGVAQSAEQLSCKQQVNGSSPFVGSTRRSFCGASNSGRRVRYKPGRVPEWTKGADCKSAGWRLRWFESVPAHYGTGCVPVKSTRPFRVYFLLGAPLLPAHIAQSVEHILGKNEVIGSSPIVGSPVFVTNAALPHAGLHKRDALHAA